MKKDYIQMNLGIIATFVNGYPFKPTEWQDTGLPIIRIQNLNNPEAAYNRYEGEIDSKYVVQKGDVLISWSGTLGVYEWDKDNTGLLNQHIFKVVFNKKAINKSFFKYAVASRINEMKSKVHGITMQHITKGEFDKTQIPYPPLAEQERIVSELDLLSGIIDKQKAQLNELDKLAKSIFYDMFGNPEENNNKWEEVKLESLCSTITKGTTPTTIGFKFEEEGINFLKVESFTKEEQLDNNKVVHISKECHKAMERSALEEDDILMCIAGATVGRLARVPKTILPANTNQAFGIIRLKVKDRNLLSYIYSYLHSPYIQGIVSESKKGVAQPNLTLGQLRDYKIVLPPKEIQSAFTAKMRFIESLKESINQSIAESQKLFDYTMDKYFG